MPARKKNISRVVPEIADEALRMANGDKKAAYSQYIRIVYRLTGKIAPGCDNRDLQAYYDLKGV